MDEDQKSAFNLAINGHNLLITGQGGTGKSFLVKIIIKHLRTKVNKKVAIVCSTGIAATNYTEFGANTLHKWSGIEDGRHLDEELIHLVKTDERFLSAKNNIETVKTLIVDEISMVSAKVLNQVQLLCKTVRNSPDLFGGIQVILVGDFYQLKPVENELYGDSGKHCFVLPWFETYFPHKINLNIIHRQDNPMLIKTINELETGDLSDEGNAFLKSMDRPIPNEESSVHLFARNLEVDLYNYHKLQSLEGQMKVYHSQDEGSQHYLDKFVAQKNLGLKINCPVMLIRNLSDTLVNGLRGVVKKLDTDSIEVKFLINEKPVFVSISRDIFTKFDPVEKIVIAKRVQFPLKACYGITIHKSQGMTLPELVVDCENSVQPGQLGVAIGRAVSVEGLKVVNFKKHLCRKHPSYVYNFHGSFSIGVVKNDLSCCNNSYEICSDNPSEYGDDDIASDDDNDHHDSDNLDETLILDDSDFSDSEIDKIDFIEKHFDLEPNADVFLHSRNVLDSVLQTFKDTPVEDKIVAFKDAILKNYKLYDDWFQCQSSIMDDIGLNCFPEGEISYSRKHRNDYFMKFNKYISSDEYEEKAISLLKKYQQDVKGPAFQVLTAVMFHLERSFFTELSTYLQLSEPEPFQKLPENIDLAGNAKLRYVSGYVLAKLKYNLSKKIRNCLYVKGKEVDLSNYQCQMNILISLCSSYDELIASTKNPDTLSEVKRKQNERVSLTNISDFTFEFFKTLELFCRERLTHKRLVDMGQFLFRVVKDEVITDNELFQAWVNCVTNSRPLCQIERNNDDICEILDDIVMSCDSYIVLFQCAVILYLKVSFSQFRKTYLTYIKKEKGIALRKKVMKRTKQMPKSFNITFFNEDNSSNKEVSMLRLKSELMQNRKYLNEHSFTKKDLILICQQYKIKVSAQQMKDEIINVLVKGILDSVSLHSHEEETPIDDEQPGPSGINPLSAPEPLSPTNTDSTAPVPEKRKRKQTKSKVKGKGKGKGKGKKKTTDDNDEYCANCNKAYMEGEDWICCDLCSLWYHRQCANLEDESEWCRLSGDEPFICAMCQ